MIPTDEQLEIAEQTLGVVVGEQGQRHPRVVELGHRPQLANVGDNGAS